MQDDVLGVFCGKETARNNNAKNSALLNISMAYSFFFFWERFTKKEEKNILFFT